MTLHLIAGVNTSQPTHPSTIAQPSQPNSVKRQGKVNSASQFDSNWITCNYTMPPLKDEQVEILDLSFSDQKTGASVPGHFPYFMSEQTSATNFSTLPEIQEEPIFSTLPISDGLETGISTLQNGTSTYQTPFDVGNGTSIPSKISFFTVLKMTPLTGAVEEAHFCALSFCTRQYNSSVTSGVLSSNILSTSNSPMSRNEKADAPNNTTQRSSYLFTNSDGSFNFEVAVNNTNTNLSIEELLSLELERILQGNITTDSIDGNTIVLTAANQLVFGLNNSADILASMDNTAAAIFVRMQALSDVVVTGQLASIESYIHVTWGWIALPGFLIVSGIGCLISAMIETKQGGLHIWKASQIALLFHGLESPIAGAPLINRASEMEEVSKRVKAKLAKEAEGHLLLQRKKDS